jgi:hypothetical protein
MSEWPQVASRITSGSRRTEPDAGVSACTSVSCRRPLYARERSPENLSAGARKYHDSPLLSEPTTPLPMSAPSVTDAGRLSARAVVHPSTPTVVMDCTSVDAASAARCESLFTLGLSVCAGSLNPRVPGSPTCIAVAAPVWSSPLSLLCVYRRVDTL